MVSRLYLSILLVYHQSQYLDLYPVRPSSVGSIIIVVVISSIAMIRVRLDLAPQGVELLVYHSGFGCFLLFTFY